jgi:hypothetical protein
MDAFFSADDRQEHLALLSQSASKSALDFLVFDELSRSLCGVAPSGEVARLHVPEKSMQFSVKVGGSSVAGALPFLFDGRTERFGVTHESSSRSLFSSSTIFREIRLTRRSVQSQADSGLPTQLILVAFRRVNHTFPYLYPRDR